MLNLDRTEILKTLENELEELFFSSESEENKTTRICPKCNNGDLGLQLGKYGAFIGCGNYPECKYTKQIAKNEKNEEDFDTDNLDENGILGQDPESGENIYIKKGPYGVYIQKGDTKKPKRIGIPKLIDPKNIDINIYSSHSSNIIYILSLADVFSLNFTTEIYIYPRWMAL